jgi:hypothetical protein
MFVDEPILPSSRKIKLIAVAIPCLLVLYVLSIGPVAKLQDCGIIGERADKVLNVVYAPMGLFAIIPGMEPFLRWYVFHLWKCDTMGDNTI